MKEKETKKAQRKRLERFVIAFGVVSGSGRERGAGESE